MKVQIKYDWAADELSISESNASLTDNDRVVPGVLHVAFDHFRAGRLVSATITSPHFARSAGLRRSVWSTIGPEFGKIYTELVASFGGQEERTFHGPTAAGIRARWRLLHSGIRVAEGLSPLDYPDTPGRILADLPGMMAVKSPLMAASTAGTAMEYCLPPEWAESTGVLPTFHVTEGRAPRATFRAHPSSLLPDITVEDVAVGVTSQVAWTGRRGSAPLTAQPPESEGRLLWINAREPGG